MLNKRALSPLVATILLVVFALIVGTATMNWSKNYVETVPDEFPEPTGSSIVISIDQINNPLKELQIKYITDQLTLDQYITRQREVVQDLGQEED